MVAKFKIILGQQTTLIKGSNDVAPSISNMGIDNQTASNLVSTWLPNILCEDNVVQYNNGIICVYSVGSAEYLRKTYCTMFGGNGLMEEIIG